MERKREEDEVDCLRYILIHIKLQLKNSDYLRYYKDQSTDRLFERWFHTTDLGQQLGPVIKE